MARDFNGSTGILYAGATPSMNGGATMTICARINTDTVSAGTYVIAQRGFFGGGPAGDSGGWTFYLSANQLIFAKNAVATVSSTATSLSANVNYLVAAVVTPTNVRFLKITEDGAATAQNISDSNAFDNVYRDVISIGAGRSGAGADGFWFNGRIQDVALWSVALSDMDLIELSLGTAPTSVYKRSLSEYFPLSGAHAELGAISKVMLSAAGSAPRTETFFSRPPRVKNRPLYVAAAGGSVPNLYHHRQSQGMAA